MKTSMLMLAAGIFLVSTGFAQQDNSEVERNKEVVKKYFEVVVNERKIDLLDELFRQDRVYINWDTGEQSEDLDQLKEFLPEMFKTVPNIISSVEEIIAEGDKVMVKINFKGTPVGEFWGFPPSGNSFNLNETFIFYLKDGKICSSTVQINFKVLESQLKRQD